MNTPTFCVTRNHDAINEVLSPFMLNDEEIYTEGLCVVLTILRRLDEHCGNQISFGGMCVRFGWTEEQAVKLLTQEIGLPPAEIQTTMNILIASPLIEWLNDLETADLFS